MTSQNIVLLQAIASEITAHLDELKNLQKQTQKIVPCKDPLPTDVDTISRYLILAAGTLHGLTELLKALETILQTLRK